MEGRSIGSAAESALEANLSFDPGTALVRLIESGMMTEIRPSEYFHIPKNFSF
jgi:hypothetical protein